jgi:glycosyltransferase involved in cell wall biosynthesis
MKLLLCVSRLDLGGPSRGIAAIANLLQAEGFDCTLVSLKTPIIDAVHLLNSPTTSLYSPPQGIHFLCSLIYLGYFSIKHRPSTISFCLLADIVNILLAPFHYRTCVYIRGDLKYNYRETFGNYIGSLLANFHYYLCRFASRTLCLDDSMKANLLLNHVNNATVIPNLIDEDRLKAKTCISIHKRLNVLDIAYCGTLTPRKNPLCIPPAHRMLTDLGYNCVFHYFGDGYLKNQLVDLIAKYDLQGSSRMFGFLKDPIPRLAGCHLLLHPSYSEGTSRSTLESLSLGVPVVMRDIPGANSYIDQSNGVLFTSDDQIVDSVLKAIPLIQYSSPRSLLPITHCPSTIRASLIQTLFR